MLTSSRGPLSQSQKPGGAGSQHDAAGGHVRFPDPGLLTLATASTVMARSVQSATVEGWHTGKEWIDGGTLNERVTLRSMNLLMHQAGVQAMIARLSTLGATLTPEALVEHCLDLMGPLTVGDETRQALLRYARSGGELPFSTPDERQASAVRVAACCN